MPVREGYFRRGEIQIEGGYREGLALLRLAEPPTAVFSCNDKTDARAEARPRRAASALRLEEGAADELHDGAVVLKAELRVREATARPQT